MNIKCSVDFIRRPFLLVLPEEKDAWLRIRPAGKNFHKTDIPFQAISIQCKMLQTGHKTQKTFISFSLSFPQKRVVFPQSVRMWKTMKTSEIPHQVFHINGFLQAKSRVFLWKTMWKLWKFSTALHYQKALDKRLAGNHYVEKPTFLQNGAKPYDISV